MLEGAGHPLDLRSTCAKVAGNAPPRTDAVRDAADRRPRLPLAQAEERSDLENERQVAGTVLEIDRRLGSALELGLPDSATLATEPGESPFDGVLRVRAADRLLVPYFTWAHRGAGEMQVWLLRQP